MGDPQNGRTEYFALESLAIDWVFKTIKVRLIKNLYLQKKAATQERIFPNGVIVLDRIILHWDITFLLEDDGIWFIGPATVTDGSVTINAGKLRVVIKNGLVEEFPLAENITIKFSAPPPLLENKIIVDEFGKKTIYIVNIVWDNSKVKSLKAIPTRTIHYEKYEMYVYSGNTLIAIISPR